MPLTLALFPDSSTLIIDHNVFPEPKNFVLYFYFSQFKSNFTVFKLQNICSGDIFISVNIKSLNFMKPASLWDNYIGFLNTPILSILDFLKHILQGKQITF